MRNILVTGSTGFVGGHLLPRLDQYDVRAIGRLPSDELLREVDTVIHLAGIAHCETSAEEYNLHNHLATARLAVHAAASGVKRFVFLSTVKVYGESSPVSSCAPDMFNEQSAVMPADAYARSKVDAEFALMETCAHSNMEYVIVRSPLVYGPGVRANFLSLLRAVSWRIPIPFKAINNRRSLIYVENLCDVLQQVVEHPAASNRIFNVKDLDDSTAGLVTRIARGLSVQPRLFSVPLIALETFASLTGSRNTLDKLVGSLLIDHRHLTDLLGWTPVVDTDTAIRRTTDWFVNNRA